jgi:PAS domain S-box-containing protein
MNTNNPSFEQTLQRHRGLTTTVFVLCLLLSGALVWWLDTERVATQRATTLALASDQAQSVESRIQRLMSATYLLAAVVRKDGGVVRQFEEVATEMLPFYPGVTSLALSPGGVISHAVPLDRNRASIGFNQLADPVQSPEAFLARDTGQLTLAGPLQLAQGGLGAVGRLPIYLPSGKGSNTFWGFANVIVRFPEALSATGLEGLTDLGYEYTLWREKPNGDRQVIAASPNVLAGLTLSDPVDRTLEVPNGQWVLSMAPLAGWGSATERGLQVLIALLFSAMVAALAHNALAQNGRRQRLERLVQQRTHDIQGVQSQLQATLDAIPDLMFDIDQRGVLHRVHALSPELLLMPADEVQGRNIHGLLPPDVCNVAHAAMAEALDKGRSLGRQYMLELPTGTFWFELSVAAKPGAPGEEPRFVFLSRDITTRKQAESDLLLAAKVFEQSSEAILITHPDQTIIKVNAAFTRITGYTPAMVVGQTPRVLSSGKHSRDFYTQMWDALLANGQWQGEVWNATVKFTPSGCRSPACRMPRATPPISSPSSPIPACEKPRKPKSGTWLTSMRSPGWPTARCSKTVSNTT